MGRTVGELRATLTTDELARWMAFHARSPVSDELFDYLFANLCRVVCMVAGAKKSRGAPRAPGPDDWTIEDFLLFNKKDKPVLSAEQFLRQRFAGLVVKNPTSKTTNVGKVKGDGNGAR